MFRLPIKHCLKSFSQHLQEAGSTYQLKTTPSTPPYLLSVLKTCYQLSTEIGDMHKVFLTWLITVTSPSPRQAQAELETRNNINAFIGTLMRRNRSTWPVYLRDTVWAEPWAPALQHTDRLPGLFSSAKEPAQHSHNSLSSLSNTILNGIHASCPSAATTQTCEFSLLCSLFGLLQ